MQVRCKCALYKAGRLEQPQILFFTRTDRERREQHGETYQGAEVIKPRVGYYEDPMATLDWAGLYPSIDETHNLCPGTLVQRDYDLTLDPHIQGCADPATELTLEERQQRAEAAVWRAPDMVSEKPYREEATDESPVFLKHGVKVGITTKRLRSLRLLRKDTKRRMNDAFKRDDDELGTLLNQRQLAIKMLANSLYGMYGATVAFLYSPIVSSTITMRGRALLFFMRWLAESEFAQYAPLIVYGDTDSIFVWLRNVTNFDDAAKVGVEMADFITKRMQETYTTDAPEYNVLVLEFEKVFRRILLLAKKRYAGLKYEYSPKTGKLTPSPAENVPTMSGLEAKRRDVTLLVSQSMQHVLSLLLDYRYSQRENMERTRAWVWEHMVRPLMNGSMNLHKLVVTKQLRKLPSQYATKNNQKPPVHVQLAAKLIERAGGENAATAPRSGDRLPYVIVRGAMDQSVSERPEDPLYALENGVRIDWMYYLDKHLRPTLLRLFMPMVRATDGQTKLSWSFATENRAESNDDDEEADDASEDADYFGVTDNERKRAGNRAAGRYLFGHPDQYHDPIPREKRKWAASVMAPTENFERKRMRPRYTVRKELTTKTVAQTYVQGKNTVQRTLFGFAKSAARCTNCAKTVVGAKDGFVCDDCAPTADATGQEALTKIGQLTRDIEELRLERRELTSTCFDCMNCSAAPQRITCKASECPVFWERAANQISEDEAERRLSVLVQTAQRTRALDSLEW